MGWIGDQIQKLVGADAVDFIVTEPLPLIDENGKRSEPVSKLLEADACYVEMFVDAMWLPKARKLTSYYHGVVHVYTSIDRIGDEKARFAFVSTPTELAKVDPKSLRQVVTRTQRALGPVPWRGGDLELELGLFSVNSGDVTDSVLDLVSSMAGEGGVAFMSAAAPFVPFVRKGLQVVTGANSANFLEIGLDKAFTAPQTGTFAIIAADRKDIDAKKLAVATDGRLLLDGETLRKHPWLVFRIGSTLQKADFGTIPELKAAWAAFVAAVRSRKRADAEEALTVFRTTALTSPDLIPSDAETLTKKAEEMMEKSFKGVMQAKAKAAALPELSQIGLYD